MIVSSIFDPAVIATFLVSATIFGSWFTFWYKTNLARTERERAYVCTLLSSSITSTCSIPLVYTLLTNGGDLTEILAYRTWTVIATTFFMTFLITDLVVGSIFYRSKIELLTGWIHHITYLGTLTWAIHNQYTAVFIMMCSLELPTFILALGSVRSQLRRDYVFASTFLVTRILFHAYAIKCAWVMKPYGPVVTALSAFFPVHCFWFYGFIKQQIRLAAKRKQEALANKQAQRKRSKQASQHIQPSVISTTIKTTIKKTSVSRSSKATANNTTSSYLSSPTPSFHQSPPVSVH
ncbi:hypothetical protein V8B55DRAFT_1378007 [Mucor lusitanicus]|uniref:TLC domain-containing protein n=2 Tax=Mucor circinelloides f. lusitanicus TaxID=29924 RepID=A0A168H3Q2_MUCCL|nr:hypothetical protein FB192DRAFT_1304569 [Mucor lusitanicus]OAC98333.1 hypothetical protein MUCCIDRAFT_115249 [Mucor lusitanicus CBS 277.49]